MIIQSVSLKGLRDSNEDVFVVKESKNKREVIAAIFDGHGGDFVSTYLGKHLLSRLSNAYEEDDIRNVLHHLHNKMVHTHPAETEECGSTVLVCRIHKNRLQTIHLGDSRAILVQRSNGVSVLTEDHTPDKERWRLSEEKQLVYWDKVDEVYRMNGYSVSRAFGDTTIPGISHEPVIASFRLSRPDYIVMACDGLWDVLSPEDVRAFVSAQERPKVNSYRNNKDNIAYRLGKKALDSGSADNVSVIIVFF